MNSCWWPWDSLRWDLEKQVHNMTSGREVEKIYKDKIRFGLVWFGNIWQEVWYSVIWFRVWCRVWYSMICCGMLWYALKFCGMEYYGLVSYCLRCGLVYGMVCFGIWYNMVWLGVCCGKVWLGVWYMVCIIFYVWHGF